MLNNSEVVSQRIGELIRWLEAGKRQVLVFVGPGLYRENKHVSLSVE